MNISVKKSIPILLLFVILGCLIYSNTLKVPYTFDDESRIEDNTDIRMTEVNLCNIGKAAFGNDSAKNRPIGNITFALNYFFHQYNLPGYHVVNIIIHILSGIFLFLFVKTTLCLLKAQGSKLKAERAHEALSMKFARENMEVGIDKLKFPIVGLFLPLSFQLQQD